MCNGESKIEKNFTFQRHEKKYLLDTAQYKELQAELSGKAQIDDYGKHTICNVYYDTDDYAIIRRCLEKPKFRTKLRLRSYGMPNKNSTVFLELKKKLAGVSYKRRISLPHHEAVDYIEKGSLPQEQPQIFGEIDWFAGQQPLSAKLILCYERTAMKGLEDESLRITFDSNLRWRDYHLDLSNGDYGSLLLPMPGRLMEIKTGGALPYWLTNTLSDLEIYPTSFSKYGTVYTHYLSGKGAMRNAG